MRRLSALTLVCAVLLAACSPPEQALAPAMTVTPQPTAGHTPLPTPTATSHPTDTPEPTATATATPALTLPPAAELITQTDGGELSSAYVQEAHLSDDGRYVAFAASLPYELIPAQVFLYDRTSGATQLISAAPDGAYGDSESLKLSISGDGSTVAFISFAHNLSDDWLDGCPDDQQDEFLGCGSLYMYDVASEMLMRIPLGVSWPTSLDTSLSADGRYIAIAVGSGWEQEGVYLYDQQAGSFLTVFESDRELGPNIEWAGRVALSADGSVLAFATRKGVGEKFLTTSDVYVYERQTGRATRISAPAAGTSTGWSGLYLSNQQGGVAGEIDISPDGRYVTFGSGVAGMVDGVDLPSCPAFVPHAELGIEYAGEAVCPQMYRYDRETGQMVLVSQTSGGEPAGGWSFTYGSISADGRWVLFGSAADNLRGDDCPRQDEYPFYCAGGVLLRDVERGETHTVAIGRMDWQPVGDITPDGRYGVFTLLTEGEANAWSARNLFFVDLQELRGGE